MPGPTPQGGGGCCAADAALLSADGLNSWDCAGLRVTKTKYRDGSNE